MALTYDKVIGVISQPPEDRKDFEVNNLLPWFRKKSDLFKNLKTEFLVDIIKNLQFVTKPKDDIIIRQGEQGDCMYILLRGSVTIFILYDKKGEGEDDKPTPPPAAANGKATSESIRAQLGTFVVKLGVGACFGEVALLKEGAESIRTASIITDDDKGNDLIIVDRELYNRSVSNVLKKEFEDKANFIATNPYFNVWPPKYKKQLAMALIKEYYPYEGTITRQGEQVADMYFILSGEVKVIMDPVQHRAQYPKICGAEAEAAHAPFEDGQTEAGDDTRSATQEIIRAMSASRERRHTDSPIGGSKFRKKTPKRQPQEVCLLGVGESIGDVEVLLELDTYMQSAICTQKTEVLILEMKHYERLLVKRNPKTIELMKDGLELKLQSRISRHSDPMPLLKCLCAKVEQYVEEKQLKTEARNNSNAQERNTKSRKTMSESFDSFVPPRGALVDMYGPGTVFYRIREREKARQLKMQKSRKMFGGAAKYGRGGGGVGAGRGGMGRHTNGVGRSEERRVGKECQQ